MNSSGNTDRPVISDGPWVTTARVTKELHIPRGILDRMRDEGLLIPGVHFLRTSPSQSARTIWCPTAIWKTIVDWSSTHRPAAEAGSSDSIDMETRSRLIAAAQRVARHGSVHDIVVYDDAPIDPVDGGYWVQAQVFLGIGES